MNYTVFLTHKDPTTIGQFNHEYALNHHWPLSIGGVVKYHMYLLASGKSRAPDKAELLKELIMPKDIEGLLTNDVPLVKEVVAILKTDTGEKELMKAIREFHKFKIPAICPPFLDNNPFE